MHFISLGLMMSNRNMSLPSSDLPQHISSHRAKDISLVATAVPTNISKCKNLARSLSSNASSVQLSCKRGMLIAKRLLLGTSDCKLQSDFHFSMT